MKKYVALDIELVTFVAQDVITTSGFRGEENVFGDPNKETESAGDF